jgi:nucleoside-diphosphate-sugar epimerase
VGDGEQTRDFIYVENAVHASLLASTASSASGKVINIASGRAISINMVLKMVAQLLGVEPRAEYQEARAGEVRHSLADVTLARQLLGYETIVTLEEGLRHTVTAAIGSRVLI